MTSIGYCANVHPGRNVAQLRESLAGPMARVARGLSQPTLPVSLWLSAETIRELSDQPSLAERLRDEAQDFGISFVAINAFPYGNFHAQRVKNAVYEPNWTDGRRAHYTLAVAELLPLLVADGTQHISISTLPLGWRATFSASGSGASVGIASAALEHIASRLHAIEQTTGLHITLDIEPEPGCAIETSEELVGFFSHCLPTTTRTAVNLRRYIGACVDVCHGAVMGEPPHEFFERCAKAGVAINRVQLSSAIKGTNSEHDLAALAQFNEPRYLHQVVTGFGASRRLWNDIPNFLADTNIGHGDNPAYTSTTKNIGDTFSPTLANTALHYLTNSTTQEWRCHWHVPIHHAMINGLETTSSAITGTLDAALRLPNAPLIEVETYAWTQLPHLDHVSSEGEVEQGIVQEIRYAQTCAAVAQAASDLA